MIPRSKECRSVFLSLMLLVLVSLYRQLSLHLLTGDLVRPYLVYGVYLALISGWAVSIRNRFTQKSMRIFLLCDAAVMAFWMTVRFAQDAFLYRYLYWMRYFGYFIFVPAALVPLLGFYASFGLGRGDDYRLSGKWYLLLLPAAALVAMALTNEQHHFVFRVVNSEPQPNLYFHPYIGICLLYGWGLMLICARTLIICKRNQITKDSDPLKKLAPFAELLLLLLFGTPYTAASFWVKWELIEFSAGVFFIEAISWEIYIVIGLIPVNTQYEKVFDRSTVAMQIVSRDGTPYVKSRRAPELSGDTFRRLREKSIISTPEGQELQIFPLHESYLVWQRDVSQIRTAIEKLRRGGEELKQESVLLSMELEFRSEEAAAKEQNAIYNQLSAEVGTQLSIMKELLQSIRPGQENAAAFRKICLIGTYIKRRCNLRLTEQTEDLIPGEDLALSFHDLLVCLGELGVETAFSGQISEDLPSAFGLRALDAFELLLEREQFAPTRVQIAFDGDFCFSVYSGRTEGTEPMGSMACETIPGGYRVILRKGEDTGCEGKNSSFPG